MLEVHSDVDNNKEIEEGSFSNEEFTILNNALHQALIIPIIEKKVLDISSVTEFKEFEDIDLKKLIDFKNIKDNKIRNENCRYVLNNKILLNTSIYEALLLELKSEYGIDYYNTNNYFTVFKFGVKCFQKENRFGSVEKVGVKNVILFPTGDTYNVLAHEVLHGFGLVHTHRDAEPLGKTEDNLGEKYKYVFPCFFQNVPYQMKGQPQSSTTNLMSYGEAKFTLWYWQWCKINNKIKKDE